MLNVGPLELLVVLAVALIVVGPERLPELARSVGRVLRQFREVQDEVRDMVSSGVDDDMRQAADEFRKATGGIKRATDVKGAVRRAERTIRDETAALRTPRTPGSKPAGRSSSPAAAPAEPSEAAAPPADQLVEDSGTTPTSGDASGDTHTSGGTPPDPESTPDR
ncbi:MAG TPA: twin-arginine translocase TatA/TatE family subunit [Actinomycetota bacterium]